MAPLKNPAPAFLLGDKFEPSVWNLEKVVSTINSKRTFTKTSVPIQTVPDDDDEDEEVTVTVCLNDDCTKQKRVDLDPEPYFSGYNLQSETRPLIGGDDVLSSASVQVVLIDYPLAMEILVVMQSSDGGKFRRNDLVHSLRDLYHTIYEIEDSTSDILPQSFEEQNGPGATFARNRVQTDGPFQIYLHFLKQLDLVSISVVRPYNLIHPQIDS